MTKINVSQETVRRREAAYGVSGKTSSKADMAENKAARLAKEFARRRAAYK